MVCVSGNSRKMFLKRATFIEVNASDSVLFGQRGFINPARFDSRKQHRRCRIQVFPVPPDEVSRRRTNSDDQIGRSVRIERREVLNKFGLCGVASASRDEGLFLNEQRPGRLSVQFSLDLPAPCGPRLDIQAVRMKEQDDFRLSGSLARLGLSGSLAN